MKAPRASQERLGMPVARGSAEAAAAGVDAGLGSPLRFGNAEFLLPGVVGRTSDELVGVTGAD